MAETINAFKFSDKGLAEIQRYISHYPEGRQKSALLPALHVAQAENNGWVSPEAMDAFWKMGIEGKLFEARVPDSEWLDPRFLPAVS